MTSQQVAAEIRQKSTFSVDSDVLEGLLEAAEVLGQYDTCVAGWIRILAFEGVLAVQEETPGGDLLVHRMASLEEARLFVEYRLGSYERMWNGCGCKIDYFGQRP
jgi:hypothetical protein